MMIRGASRSDALVLAALAMGIALVRTFSFDEPPDWDVGTYLVVGHEIRCGERLYLDIWDSKPPAIFATYAAAERAAGYGYRQTYLLSVVAASVTMLGIFFAGSVHGRVAARWAALFWACICFEPRLGANQPNTEVFINAALVWALALMMRDEGRSQWWRYASIGLLCSVASFYKQVAVAPAAMLAAAHVIWPPENVTRRRAALDATTLALVGALAWAGLFGYFALTGRAWIFWQTMFVHARWYGGNPLVNVARSFLPENLFPADARFILPLALAALLVFVPRAVEGSDPAHDPAAAPRRGATPRRSRGMRPGKLLTVGAVVAIGLIQPQLWWFALPGDEWAARKHGSFYARALRDARDIAATLQPSQTLYTWSDEAWLYFITNRRVPAIALWKSHTLHGPLAPWLARRTVEDLDRNPPDLFIDWVTLPAPDEHPIARWYGLRYHALDAGKTRWPFVVYRRDDRLAK
jgi:hypothetical protein